MQRRISIIHGTVIVVLCAACCATPDVQGASLLFSENFNGYTSFPDQIPVGDPANAGLPSISEGANYDWYGARFQTTFTGSIDSDLAVQQSGGNTPDSPVGRFEDDAGILFRVNTVGYQDVVLQFDWRTFQAEGADRFVAGYYVGNIDFTTDAPDGPFDNRVRNFATSGPAWSSWTELVRGKDEAWRTVAFNLPSGQTNVWVAFWLDDGEGDYGKVDNISVVGTSVPEPTLASLFVLGAGLFLMRHMRSRRLPAR
jgi:hypothetical protein